MLKKILIIIISVSIFILIFSIVRKAMQNKINELIKEEKNKKKKL